MNKKGFVLMETIVVIVIISVALLAIFSSYNKLLSKVKTENKYDTSEYIYMTYYIRKYLKGTNVKAVDINTEDVTNLCVYLDDDGLNIFNAKKIYIVKNLNKLSDRASKFDAYMIDYIKRLDVRDNDSLIIVEYQRPAKKDGTMVDLKEYGTDNIHNILYETYISSLEW